jgi:stearoyl-CoA desaturase (delta-9 desaturase)
MTRTQRIGNLVGVVIPFLGVIAAIVLLWNDAVDAIDLALLAGTYVVLGLGVTIGYHRLLTHGSFQTHPWLRYTFATLGSMSLQRTSLQGFGSRSSVRCSRRGPPYWLYGNSCRSGGDSGDGRRD